MARFPASKILGIGSISSSSTTGKRRWATELRAKVAAGTRVKQFTQGESLLASVETILTQIIPSFANNKATGSFVLYPSMTAGNTLGVGTFTVLLHGKTLNRVWRCHVLVIGPPDPLRTGA